MKYLYIIGLFGILSLISSIAAEPITLYNINVSYDNVWKLNTDNIITVTTLDMNRNLTDVDNVLISSAELNLSDSAMLKSNVGTYYSTFNLKNVSSNITFSIVANDQMKYVNETVFIKVEQSSAWADFKLKLDSFIDEFKGNFTVWFLSLIIVLFSVLSLILFFEILSRRKK